MHPDALIAALRRELERLDPDAPDHAERRKAIEAEIKATDKLDRPEVAPEEPDTVVDHNVGYLEGLKRELSRVAAGEKERVSQIKAEIKRVEALIHAPAQAAPEPEAEPEQEASDADADQAAA